MVNRHVKAIQHRNYMELQGRRIAEKKPFQCIYCKWRTDDENKIKKHVIKYDKIFTHPEVRNPHKYF